MALPRQTFGRPPAPSIPPSVSRTGHRFTADDRSTIDRLVGQVDGLKQSQTMLGVATGLVAAAIIGITAYIGVETYNLAGKVDGLPDKLNASIRDANMAFATAVNTSLQAFKQGQQQPIIIQAPPTVPRDGARKP